jgi:hypothetical protein
LADASAWAVPDCLEQPASSMLPVSTATAAHRARRLADLFTGCFIDGSVCEGKNTFIPRRHMALKTQVPDASPQRPTGFMVLMLSTPNIRVHILSSIVIRKTTKR